MQGSRPTKFRKKHAVTSIMVTPRQTTLGLADIRNIFCKTVKRLFVSIRYTFHGVMLRSYRSLLLYNSFANCLEQTNSFFFTTFSSHTHTHLNTAKGALQTILTRIFFTKAVPGRDTVLEDKNLCKKALRWCFWKCGNALYSQT